MKNKIAVTGALGQLGSRLVRMGAEPLTCDITDKKDVEGALDRVKPDVVLHLAAHTSVDWCENHRDEAITVNTYGTNTVCQVAEEVIGVGKVVVISSDQVFDGQKGQYKEDDEQNPVNYYGRSKLGAEAIANLYGVKIIRISRCFDSKSADISSYLKKLENNQEIHVPDFFFRSYCHLDLMAEMFGWYAYNFEKMPRLLHLASSFSCSFYHLMQTIADFYGYDLDLVCPRGEEAGHTPRPHNAGLDISFAHKLGFRIPTVGESIRKMKNERL